MYLVACRMCRTEFANEARMCPSCGHLRNHIAAQPQSWERTWPTTEVGETRWDRKR